MRKFFDLQFELKESDDQGKFSGIASIYGAVDLGGDVVERGAFAKSLSERPVVPILWQHRSDEVIGEGKVRSTREGLMVDASLDIDVDPIAHKAFQKMKRGRIRGLSIGYETIKDELKNGIRHLLEIKLWEISVVTFPMLPAAQVTSVKSAEEIQEFMEMFWANEPGIKAALAQDPELKQKFMSLIGEAGTPTSTKTADAPNAEPVFDHSVSIREIDRIKEAIYGAIGS